MNSSLTKVSSSGLRHGLINEVGNSVPDDGFKRFAEKDRPKMEKLRKESERIVKAQYLSREGAKGRLERPYCEWAGQKIQTWCFLHGETYDVPKGLVDDVNSPHKRPKKRSDLVDQEGVPLAMDGYEEPMDRFVPVGF